MVVARINTPFSIWMAMLTLICIHLGMNYAAVRSVTMRTLNRQRANIVLSRYICDKHVYSPSHVSAKERIFERDGILRWTGGESIGFAAVGVGLDDLVKGISSGQAEGGVLNSLLEIFKDERYILWPARGTILIALKRGSSPRTQLKAWYHALALARYNTKTSSQKIRENRKRNREPAEHPKNGEIAISDTRSTLEQVSHDFEGLQQRLTSEGWDLDTAAIETRSGARVQISREGAVEGNR